MKHIMLRNPGNGQIYQNCWNIFVISAEGGDSKGAFCALTGVSVLCLGTALWNVSVNVDTKFLKIVGNKSYRIG
jgi:hypothetical protein